METSSTKSPTPSVLIDASEKWERTYRSELSQPEAAAFTGEYKDLLAVMRQFPVEACDYYFAKYPTGKTEFLILLCSALDIDIKQIGTLDKFKEKLTPLVKQKRASLAKKESG